MAALSRACINNYPSILCSCDGNKLIIIVVGSIVEPLYSSTDTLGTAENVLISEASCSFVHNSII